MAWEWFKKKVLPDKLKDDASIAEITAGIVKESRKLDKATTKLEQEVSSMQVQREAMNLVFEEALAIVQKRVK